MKLVKRTEHLNSRPLRPICVGKSAFITKNGMIHRTKAVTALHHNSADYIYFETQDAYYHLSFSPFNHTTSVMQVQVLQAS